MSHTEEVKRHGSTVDHDIIGDTLDEVLVQVTKTIGQYHPMGYGTAVVKIVYMQTPHGMRWNALVRRANSCD